MPTRCRTPASLPTYTQLPGGAAQHLLTLLLPSELTAEADTLLSVKEKQPRVGLSFREALKIHPSWPARAVLCLLPDTSIPLAAGEPLPCAPCGWQAAPGQCQPPEGRADKEELRRGTLQGSDVHTQPQLTHLGATATGCSRKVQVKCPQFGGAPGTARTPLSLSPE